MAKEITRLTLEEFAANVTAVFDRVVTHKEPVLVEKSDGGKAVIRPVLRGRAGRKRGITAEDYDAFLSSAGGWKDVDTEALKKDIYESRSLSSRAPVEL